ncbi:MAG: protein kinase, partial [Kofleriaceae bacterium]|nr:protein kinase [Kofleriaceae bacterium]
LRGLGAAHGRVAMAGKPAPVIHRDGSPHNVLLGINGVVKLSDFGLARARDRIASLTAPGTVKGKLSYLAPEVAFGKPNSVQSDLFGVGNILWETLLGERLFDGKTDVEIFKKIRNCTIPPIAAKRPDVPAAFLAVMEVALAADPNNRYGSADEFAHALSQVMKEAVGTNVATALGQVVADLRTSKNAPVNAKSMEIEFSTADLAVDPVPLTTMKRPTQQVTVPDIKKKP